MAEAPDRTGPTALTAASQTLITAGGAATWTLIRKLIVVNVTIAPITVTLGIGTTNTDTLAKRILSGVTIQPGKPLIEDGFAVLKGHASTPDLLYGFCDIDNAINVYAALVTGP